MVIRKMLLCKLGANPPAYSRRKHAYYVSALSTLNLAASTASSPNVTTIGTGATQRIGNCIRMHSLRVKYCFWNQRVAAPVAYGLTIPVIQTIDVVIDHIPLAVGTAPPMYVVDANPQASNTGVFTNLGVAITAPWPIPQLHPTRNINTTLDYSILYHRCHQHDPHVMTTSAGTMMVFGQPFIHREKVFDLHGTIAYYASTAATDACINALWITCACTNAAGELAALGTAVYGGWIADLEFEDVLDDI